MIIRTKRGWAVKSSSGRKFLSRKDLSKEEALKRLRQIEHFKHVSTNEIFTSNAQPQRTDPSKTGDIRRAFVRESNARFRDFKKALIEFLVKQDELALKPSSFVIHGGPGSGNFGHAGRPGERGGSAPGGGLIKQDKEITAQAYKDSQAIDDPLIREHLEEDVGGVVLGGATLIDKYYDSGERLSSQTKNQQWLKKHIEEQQERGQRLYDSYRFTREKLREKYGDTVRLYRAQGKGEEASVADWANAGKNTLYWASKEHASDFLDANRELISKDIPIDDIVGVYVPDPKLKYEEFIVLNPKSSSLVRPKKDPTPATHARRYEFQTSAQKLEAFSTWLDDQMDSKILSKGKGIWAGRYIDSAYKRGIVRAYTDVHGADLAKMQKGAAGATKAEFLRASMAVPERIDSVQLLATRTFEGMKGLTSRAKSKMNFILANGLANGEGPASMAREMVDAIDIEQGRAETIARTETAHAQAEGQLSGYDELGVEEVGLQVEFLTAGDDRVCEKCQELADDGPYTIEQARGLIPAHPSCRCAWAPITMSPSERRAR